MGLNARDLPLFIININVSGKYNPTTTIWSDMSSIPRKHHGVGWLPTVAYLYRWNSSYILNAKWFHPAVRNGINMWMAFLAQIYFQTWLPAPGVLSNIGAEQIKRKEREKRETEREILADSCFLHASPCCKDVSLRSVLRQLTHCSRCN